MAWFYTRLPDRAAALPRRPPDPTSERTIKNAIQALTARLHLRNRSHAVAYAVRQGLI
jgi:hypothetical protein